MARDANFNNNPGSCHCIIHRKALDTQMARISLFDKRSAGGSLGELLNRPRPSAWQQFLSQPCVYLARQLYTSSWAPMIPA